jgi:hypothetical protein
LFFLLVLFLGFQEVTALSPPVEVPLEGLNPLFQEEVLVLGEDIDQDLVLVLVFLDLLFIRAFDMLDIGVLVLVKGGQETNPGETQTEKDLVGLRGSLREFLVEFMFTFGRDRKRDIGHGGGRRIDIITISIIGGFLHRFMGVVLCSFVKKLHIYHVSRGQDRDGVVLP